jgi:hypothetical protein
MKVLGNFLRFPTKKRIRAFGLLELEIWAAGQIMTSPLLLRFGLPNNSIESCTPMNVLGLCLSVLAI